MSLLKQFSVTIPALIGRSFQIWADLITNCVRINIISKWTRIEITELRTNEEIIFFVCFSTWFRRYVCTKFEHCLIPRAELPTASNFCGRIPNRIIFVRKRAAAVLPTVEPLLLYRRNWNAYGHQNYQLRSWLYYFGILCNTCEMCFRPHLRNTSLPSMDFQFRRDLTIPYSFHQLV